MAARGVGRPARAVAAVAVAPVRRQIDPQLLDAARIGVEHLDLERAGARHQLAAHRHAADAGGDVAGERIHLVGDLADVEVRPDGGGDVLELGARVGQERAVGLAHHVGPLVLVVLVLDLADDLLDDVLDRDHPVGAAVFVDHQRQMDAAGLHARQQVHRRHRRRHEQHLANELGGGQRHRQIDRLEVEIGGRELLAARLAGGAHFRARRHERHQVADVDHADGVVEHLVIDHQPRMAGAGEHLHELAERDLLLDRDDVGARHHDVHHPPLAQAEDVLQHDAFFGRETGLARACLEDIRKVGPDRAGLPSEEHPQRPHQPAFAALVRHQAAARDRHRQIAPFVGRTGHLGRAGLILLGHGGQQSGLGIAGCE